MASDSNGNQWYQPVVGLGNVGSYQVSGIPFASGSIPVPEDAVTVIEFPQVTKSIIVKNLTLNNLRVGFSENGVNGTNYFILGYYESFAADLRISRLYLKGNTAPTSVTIIAGLTGISKNELASNWSGSAGVG